MTVNDILNFICDGLQNFGKSMQDIQDEFADDISKSNQRAEKREKINKENLKKIWGKESRI